MKWFTATNERSLKDDGFFELLTAAVLSAQKNTSLDPYLLYEGDLGNERLGWLEQKDVTVLPHELSFREKIEAFCKANDYDQHRIRAASGAYLRSELPVALVENNIDDDFILYTDCDVLFIRDPNLDSVKPSKFAAHGQWEGGYTRYNFGGLKHYNSGVMLMNVKSMYKDHDKFVDFVLRDGYNKDRPNGRYWQKNLLVDDQLAWNLFYDRAQIDDLKSSYNWNPSRGINDEAHIVHFYGIKWNQIRDLKNGNLDKPNYALEKYKKMYVESRKSYDHYQEIACNILNT